MTAGPITFWGEWEPPSRVVETFAGGPADSPRWLHEPFWEVPRHKAILKNSDPLVFGDHFLYSNCRQGRNRKLRELAPGSIVIFGSKLRGEFVLDTVVVVRDVGTAFTRASAGTVPCEGWVRAVVFDPLTHDGPAAESFRSYSGVTYDEAPNGPYSFVPCRPYRVGDAAFPRPSIRLDTRWIDSNLAMAAKATPADTATLRGLWQEIVDQVVVQGLALGVHLEAPPLRHADTPR